MDDSDREDGTNPPGSDDEILADLTEEISRRLESGEPVTGCDLGDDPKRAGSIRQLMPALRKIVSLGELVAREESARTRFRKSNSIERAQSIGPFPGVEEVGP